jgi:hypothetical protein
VPTTILQVHSFTAHTALSELSLEDDTSWTCVTVFISRLLQITKAKLSRECLAVVKVMIYGRGDSPHEADYIFAEKQLGRTGA